MHRAIPEFNRICVKASRERAFAQHIEALKSIQHSKKPKVGLNPETYVVTKDKASTKKREGFVEEKKAVNGVRSSIPKKEPKSILASRPYTLRGQAQRDELARINYENAKILHAVQTSKPTLSRNEWLEHRLEHKYQVTKISEFTKTVPKTDIIKDELDKTYGKKADSSLNTTHPSHTILGSPEKNNLKDNSSNSSPQKQPASKEHQPTIQPESKTNKESSETKADMTDHAQAVIKDLMEHADDSVPEYKHEPEPLPPNAVPMLD